MAVLTYRSTELRDLAANRHYFAITGGWRDGVATRGVDWVLPGAAGMYELNRVDDHRVIMLEGYVLSTSEADWDTEMGVLEALFDPALGSGNLVVASPYMGLAAGTRTIACRVANYIVTDVVPQLVSRWDVTLHAIGNPPDWA